MKNNFQYTLALLIFIFVGCDSKHSGFSEDIIPNSEDYSELIDNYWKLDLVSTQEKVEHRIDGADYCSDCYILKFTTSKSLTGIAFGQEFTGKCLFGNEDFVFTYLSSFDENNSDSDEMLFRSLMLKVKRYKIVEDNLYMYTENEVEYLVFKKGQQECNAKYPELTDKEWMLDSMSTGENNVLLRTQMFDNDDNYVFRFHNEVGGCRAEGRGFCNNASSSYYLKDDRLLLPFLLQTFIHCPNEEAYENVYFSLLGDVKRYEIKQNKLYLYTSNKDKFLVFNEK